MILATWNVNSLRVRLPQLRQWLEAARPDVVGLQETKCVDGDFPADALRELGYAVAYSGQKTYNGVAIMSRAGAPADVLAGIPGFADEQRRAIAATVNGVRFVNLYCPNGQAVGSEKYEYKLRWFAAVRDWLRDELARHPRVAVVGDFNVAPDDRDVHDPAAWAGQVLCSEPERAALRAIAELGFADCFRKFDQAAGTFSWWDYRAAAFRRNHGLRIDHVLASPTLASSCTACRIDREPRTWERPSDHAPVLAEFSRQVRSNGRSPSRGDGIPVREV
jgi:exodeoxyribonuclease-3